jgi:hypothetical protein
MEPNTWCNLRWLKDRLGYDLRHLNGAPMRTDPTDRHYVNGWQSGLRNLCLAYGFKGIMISDGWNVDLAIGDKQIDIGAYEKWEVYVDEDLYASLFAKLIKGE